MTQINLPTKQRQTQSHREQTGCQGVGVDGRRMGWEFEVTNCQLLYEEWIHDKFLMYRAENYI